MSAFLTDDWIMALGEALAPGADLDVDEGTTDLTVQQVVTDVPGAEPDGIVAFHMVIRPDRIGVVRGRSNRPDVTFTQDYRTAAAINAGTQSAQTAFMTGRLRLGGNVAALLEHQFVIASLTDAFAALRASTTY